MNKILFDKKEKISRLVGSFAKRFALITDEHVEKLYGRKIAESLTKAGLEVIVCSFPSGEKFKTRRTKESIEDMMFKNGLGRDCAVIGLGGGVVSDLAGFVASTYCRGVPLFLIPTTLLGMVDASVGGKTGVNTPYGKNLIGSFYLPEITLIDTSFLSTLSEQEKQNGFAEVIKYGLISSPTLFKEIELDETDWEAFIRQSAAIKQKVVKIDPDEKIGFRRILNFGHTIGHALETLSHYQINHGEAVAMGMFFESYLSVKLGFLSPKAFERIHVVLRRFPLETLFRFSAKKLTEAIALDKKAKGGSARFVLLQRIGKTVPFDGEYCAPVPAKLIQEAYDYLSNLAK